MPRKYKPKTKDGLPHHNCAKPLRIHARMAESEKEVRGMPKVDGRTREGRAAKKFREELIAYLGGSPSVIERAIVERCVFLQLKCSLMDQKIAGGYDSEYDSKVYLAWSNSMQRSLLKLGYRESVEVMRRRAENQLLQSYNKR